MTTFLIFEKSNKDGILIVNLIKKYFFLVEQKNKQGAEPISAHKSKQKDTKE